MGSLDRFCYGCGAATGGESVLCPVCVEDPAYRSALFDCGPALGREPGLEPGRVARLAGGLLWVGLALGLYAVLVYQLRDWLIECARLWWAGFQFFFGG